jgi:hypothetical protein
VSKSNTLPRIKQLQVRRRMLIEVCDEILQWRKVRYSPAAKHNPVVYFIIRVPVIYQVRSDSGASSSLN